MDTLVHLLASIVDAPNMTGRQKYIVKLVHDELAKEIKKQREQSNEKVIDTSVESTVS